MSLLVDKQRRITEPPPGIELAASLQELVMLTVSYGVSFNSDTTSFLLQLCERIDESHPQLHTTLVARELHRLTVMLNDLIARDASFDDAAVAAQVWRIEAVAAYEQALETVVVQARSRASRVRRYGLRYFDDADVRALAALMALAQNIGDRPDEISPLTWLVVLRAIGSAPGVTREERIFMIDQLATYILDESGIAVAETAHPLIEAAADGRPVQAVSRAA